VEINFFFIKQLRNRFPPSPKKNFIKESLGDGGDKKEGAGEEEADFEDFQDFEDIEDEIEEDGKVERGDALSASFSLPEEDKLSTLVFNPEKEMKTSSVPVLTKKEMKQLSKELKEMDLSQSLSTHIPFTSSNNNLSVSDCYWKR
jgi:hypothetical protein